jgi:hypothetical protein
VAHAVGEVRYGEDLLLSSPRLLQRALVLVQEVALEVLQVSRICGADLLPNKQLSSVFITLVDRDAAREGNVKACCAF